MSDQPNTTPIKDEIYSILRNQYDYSDDPEYTWEDLVSYNSLEEAAQTITTYIDNKIEEALNKQRGMQKITAYIPIEKGGLDED